MPFTFEKLSIPDVVLITPTVLKDHRGYFYEMYKSSEYRKLGIAKDFVQDGYSMGKKGVVKGLHYQLNPMAQGKLMHVVSGRAIEFVVDIRNGSPYFGKWTSAELSGENKKILWIPEGFAGGIAILEDETLLFYKTTSEYSKTHERGILWNDPAIGIKWPEIANPILSEKDAVHPTLKEAEMNFNYK
jgi:dTDP-4-dehydrorhamnose 3,5-epimerase